MLVKINTNMGQDLIEVIKLINNGYSISGACTNLKLNYNAIYKEICNWGIQLPKGRLSKNDVMAAYSFKYGIKAASKRFNNREHLYSGLRSNLKRRYGSIICELEQLWDNCLKDESIMLLEGRHIVNKWKDEIKANQLNQKQS